jgi:hypothetical protein
MRRNDMRVIDRNEQRAKASAGYGQDVAETREAGLSDAVFDGAPMPREISARNWLREGDVHDEQILASALPTTRTLLGPQVSVTRDDMRRTTWAVDSDGRGLTLSKFVGPQVERNAGIRAERRSLADGAVWRHSLALDKYSGEVRIAWVTRNSGVGQLWLDGHEVKTACKDVDFPFLALSQAPVGHVQSEAPPFAVLTYKCRSSGELFVRRIAKGEEGREIPLGAGKTLGGAAVAVHRDEVLVRIDLLKGGKLAPALIRSTDGGRSFGKPAPIDLGAFARGFTVIPGYAKPIVDKGGSFHVPIGLTSSMEALALNFIVRDQTLVEAIRVPGINRKTDVEVFPSTVGSEASYGNGVSDGHGLIMVVSTEDGRLYSSNSSAGGIYFPEAALLNHEMPRVAAFTASECYSGGLKANIVSMDYLFVEADDRGQPISPQLHIETWDMPLPLPSATARAKGSSILLAVESDCDLEPGKVMVHFDDPAIRVTDLDVTGLRSAVVKTNSEDLKGKTIYFDVLTLFHKHHGSAVVE